MTLEKRAMPMAVTEQLIDGNITEANLRGHSVRGGAITLLAQVFRFVLTIGSVTILARLLTPTDFGLLAMAFAIISFGEMFSQLGLPAVTIQRPTISHQQVNAMFWLSVVLGASGWFALHLSAPLIAWVYGDPRMVGISRTLGLMFVLGAVSSQHRALLSREMRFLTLASIEIVSLAIGVGVGVTAAWKGMGYWSLVLMYLARDGSAAVGLWLSSSWRPGWPARCADMRSLVTFGANITAGQFVHNFARQCDSLLLGWWAGPFLLGIYSKAYQLATLPGQLVDMPLTRVLIPALSRLQSDPARYRDYYRTAAMLLAAMEMPIVAFLFVNADQVVPIVLGPQWAAATPLFRVLAIAVFLWPVSTLMDWAFVSLGHVNRQLRWELVTSGLMVLGFIIGLRWGAMGMALAFVIVFCGLRVGLPSLRYCFRGTPVTVRDAIGAVSRPAIASISAALLLVLIEWPLGGAHEAWGLLLEVVLYGLLYLVAWSVLPGGHKMLGQAIAELKAIVPPSARDELPAAPRLITVVLRYDDYTAVSHTEIERTILSSLRRHGLCCTFAVVPASVAGSQTDRSRQDQIPLCARKAAILHDALRAGTVEVALHGHSHQTRRGRWLGGFSEFGGGSVVEQWEKIRSGKQFLQELHGFPVTTFVPPWNTYDVNTLEMLQRADFQTISADLEGPLDHSGKIMSIPATCTLLQLKDAIKWARDSRDPSPVITALFHQFDFADVDPRGAWTSSSFDELLQWLSVQPDIRIRTVGQLAEANAAPRLRDLRVLRAMHRIGHFVPHTGPRPHVCWSSSRIIGRSLCSVALFAGVFYAAVIAVAIWLGRAASVLSLQNSWSTASLLGGTGMIILLLSAGAALRNADRRIKLCVVLSALLGSVIGIHLEQQGHHAPAAPNLQIGVVR